MEYFYTPSQQIGSEHLTIEGEEFAHLTHVMRKMVGDDICVVDGAGNAYDARIVEISRRSARCRISAHHPLLHEPRIDLTLGVGILKNSSRFDFLVEKTTEIGIRTIIPLLTERTIPRHARTDRWQKLALAAMKQSGRCLLPKIQPLTRLEDFLSGFPAEISCYLMDENVHGVSLPRSLTTDRVVICIGPEGGFSPGETNLAAKVGFQLAGLGSRRLRTETAAVVAAATVLL
jgi:16S rRNA (uracil1498-N3)-methyltransferase